MRGQQILKLRDFAKIGRILDATVEDGGTEPPSLTYSLADEQAAKKMAVAETMRRAIGRAAWEPKRQQLDTLRYMSPDGRKQNRIAW